MTWRVVPKRSPLAFPATAPAVAVEPVRVRPQAKAAQVLAVSSGLLREALRHADAGNTARAGQLLDRVLEQDPRNLPALLHLGGIRRAQRQLYESLLLYQRALRLNARDARAHLGLGRTFEALGWVQTAEAHLRLALDAHPNMIEAFVDLSRCLLAQGRHEEAAVASQEAILLAPDHRQAHALLQQALGGDQDDAA